MKIKGYKAFNKDLTCDPDPKRPFQYEVGRTYEMQENPILCVRGFHFCGSVSECYNFYPTSRDTRICEVEAYGWLEFSEEAKEKNGKRGKMVTNRLTILRELSHEEILDEIKREIDTDPGDRAAELVLLLEFLKDPPQATRIFGKLDVGDDWKILPPSP